MENQLFLKERKLYLDGWMVCKTLSFITVKQDFILTLEELPVHQPFWFKPCINYSFSILSTAFSNPDFK